MTITEFLKKWPQLIFYENYDIIEYYNETTKKISKYKHTAKKQLVYKNIAYNYPLIDRYLTKSIFNDNHMNDFINFVDIYTDELLKLVGSND